MRHALVGLTLVTLGACGAEQATDPANDDTLLPPPPETGQAFHLSFDGSNDRVLVPWDESFPTQVFTAVARIRLPAPTQRAGSHHRSRRRRQLECVPFGTCVSGDRFVADGAWHHVALTRDASATLVFYIDGEERARCEGTGIPSSNNRQFLSFGATHGTIGPPPGGVEPPIWFFPGEIDDPAMWNRSLSALEIEGLQQDGIDLASAGLVGSWSFNEGEGQEVYDRSAAWNHGYLGADPGADSADPGWTR